MHILSWDQPQRPFPGVTSPTALYNSLTGLFGGGTVNPDTYKVAKGKSIIDCVREDLNRYKALRMSSADTKRLNDWTDLLHYTTGPATPTGGMCTMDTATNPAKLNLTSTRLMEATQTGTRIDIDKTVKAFMDLSVLTAMCDKNRVIFLKMPGNFTYRNLNLTMESHSVSHRTGNANQGGPCVANALDMVHTIDKYYAELFAYFVGRLDGFAEGDGKTVLDNTATVWFQEMSDGNSHNLNNMPILQAGSAGGYFKVGQAVNVEGGKADLTRGNSDGDCVNGQSGFSSLDGVGTPANVATMPINKYYVGLLNAIGVKGGADGWPAKGGTAPVTKFGKYDDSAMFRDGGTAAATAKNPGEYMELRAT
jgi:hypothetical protein